MTEPIVGQDNEVVSKIIPDPEFWNHWCPVQRDHMGTATGEPCSWCDQTEVTE